MKESCPVIWTEEVDSTNNEALRHSDCTDGMSVWAASYQTAGRGQRGNVWISSRGENLTFSILVRFGSGALGTLRALRQFAVSQAVTLGITDYLSSRGIEASIKWPNDIWVEDRKICGILVENRICEDMISRSIIGIGLNVNQKEFPLELPNPTSMSILTGSPYDPKAELEDLVPYLSARLRNLDSDESLQAEYESRLYRRGVLSEYSDNTLGGIVFKGTITGVSPFGKLRIETNEGELKEFAFKEISFVI